MPRMEICLRLSVGKLEDLPAASSLNFSIPWLISSFNTTRVCPAIATPDPSRGVFCVYSDVGLLILRVELARVQVFCQDLDLVRKEGARLDAEFAFRGVGAFRRLETVSFRRFQQGCDSLPVQRVEEWIVAFRQLLAQVLNIYRKPCAEAW